MKTTAILFLLALGSINLSAQNNEFVYTNAEYGIEVKLPAKPVESIKKEKDLTTITITSNLIFTAGLGYTIIIQKQAADFDGVKGLGMFGKVNFKYKVGQKEVAETEMSIMGAFMKSKTIQEKNIKIILSVSSNSAIQDKDVFPFFNSIKIDGVLIQNPTADNRKFKEYAIDDHSKTKTDTVKQIVYVNSDTKSSYRFEKLSDVDKNIPQNPSTNPYRFALIIGNEDYRSRQLDLTSESNVDFAKNDASAFKEYCISTLGIPEKNITFLLDATSGQIGQGVAKLTLLSKASNGKAQLIVFYAGHGLPDETTKEPYLIPVDVSGANVTSGIKLQDLYSNLTEFPSERVSVYLDACFTGGGRNAGLIASRGVKVKPKEGVLKGNIVVFSSSSGDQSSLPYADQKHGMFTYYLLKKLQETKGDVSYSELSSFLQEKISIESLLVNSKEQNPVVNTSQEIAESWKAWRLK
jgi:hypothetical protein